MQGNGTGNGCCQPSGDYITTMVDRTVDQSYKFMLQTFVKKEGTNLHHRRPIHPDARRPGTRLLSACRKSPTRTETNAAEIEKLLGDDQRDVFHVSERRFEVEQVFQERSDD